MRYYSKRILATIFVLTLLFLWIALVVMSPLLAGVFATIMLVYLIYDTVNSYYCVKELEKRDE